MPSINRKIMFFDLYVKRLNHQTNTLEAVGTPADLVVQAFNRVNGLPFLEEGGPLSRYYNNTDGNKIFAAIDHCDEHEIRGRLVLSRHNQLPDLEVNGQLTPILNSIPAESGIAEVTHFIVFPQHSLLGVELNYYGPRASALEIYLPSKAPSILDAIEIKSRLNNDIEGLLRHSGEVSLCVLSLKSNALQIARDIDEDLGAAFEAASRVSDAESLEIVLRKKKFSKDGYQFPFDIQRLLGVLRRENVRDGIEKFRLEAREDEGKFKPVDLLEDKLVFVKQVVQLSERTKRIDTNSVYSAIAASFEEIIDQFQLRG